MHKIYFKPTISNMLAVYNFEDISSQFNTDSIYTWSRWLKYNWTEGRQEVCRLEEELNKDAVCHQFCLICTANALPRKLWMGLETSTSEGKLFKL